MRNAACACCHEVGPVESYGGEMLCGPCGNAKKDHACDHSCEDCGDCHTCISNIERFGNSDGHTHAPRSA